MVGHTSAKGGAPDSYNTNNQVIGPIGISGASPAPPQQNINFAQTVGCNAVSTASSGYSFTSAGNLFQGNVTSTATASAWPGCGRTWAQSDAASKLNIFEGKAFRNGQIFWKPRFSTGTSVKARRTYDHIDIQYYDNASNSLLSAQDSRLLSISAILEDSYSLKNPSLIPFVEWNDSSLDGFLYNGSFEINLSNPYIVQPGLLRIVAADGVIRERIANGRFEKIASFLPAEGNPAQFSLPFSTEFPSSIEFDYDFSPILPVSGDLDSSIVLDGSVEAYAEAVPGPLPLAGAGLGIGFSRKLKSRIRQASR
jgi:hypothetical protein